MSNRTGDNAGQADEKAQTYTLPRRSEIRLGEGEIYVLAPLDLGVMAEVEEHFGSWAAWFTALQGFRGVLEVLWRLMARAVEDGYAPAYQRDVATRDGVGKLVHIDDVDRIRDHLLSLLKREVEAVPNGERTVEEKTTTPAP